MPEVETIKRIIEHQIVKRKIESIKILNTQVIAYPDADNFILMLENQTIMKMSRRGKFLSIHFENGIKLSLHLRMTANCL